VQVDHLDAPVGALLRAGGLILDANRIDDHGHASAAGEPVNDDGTPLSEDHSGGFARGHYEQHMRVEGTIRVCDDEWNLDGFGLRDHSWGPRSWQSPKFYRWLTCEFDEGFGFMGSQIVMQNGVELLSGFVFKDGENHFVLSRLNT
jgi:predicted secreted hydrolase